MSHDHHHHHGHDHDHGHHHDQGLKGLLRYLRYLPSMWSSDVNAAVIDELGVRSIDRVVDVGAGMGAGVIPLASTGAQVTLGVGKVPHGETSRFGMMEIGADSRIVSYEEKPSSSSGDRAFMGVYLVETPFLRRILLDSPGAHLNLDVLRPMMTDPAVVRAYSFDGYDQARLTLVEIHPDRHHEYSIRTSEE